MLKPSCSGHEKALKSRKYSINNSALAAHIDNVEIMCLDNKFYKFCGLKAYLMTDSS